VFKVNKNGILPISSNNRKTTEKRRKTAESKERKVKGYIKGKIIKSPEVSCSYYSIAPNTVALKICSPKHIKPEQER
jgi:hypothetical protein